MTYLNENWVSVKLAQDPNTPCYWWKAFTNFTVFLNREIAHVKTIDFVKHDRDGCMNVKRPNGFKLYQTKYMDWLNFDFMQFMNMIHDFELYDKKESLKNKLNRMKADF
jgi:fumarate reductase subunit C